MKRKGFVMGISCLSIITLTGILSGCSSNNSASGQNSASAQNTSSKSGKTVTLNFYDWTDEQSYMKQVINAFEKANPNIKVTTNFIPSSDYAQKLLVNLSTGVGMDVFTTASTTGLAEYASKNVLEPLDQLASSSDLSGIKDAIDQAKYNNHIYGLPYRTDKWVLYYNVDLFKKAGIPAPNSSWTWKKYEEVAKQLTSGSGKNKVYGSLSYQATSTWWRVLANIEGANNPLNPNDLQKFKQALQYNYNLTYTDGAQQPYNQLVGNAGSDYTARFLQGKTAMMFNGDWEVQMLNQAIQQKGAKLNYDIAPLPHWTGTQPASTGTFTEVMVNKKSSHMAAAEKLAEFIASEKAAKIFAGNGLLSPWTTDAVKQAYTAKVTTPAHASVFYDKTKMYSQVPMDPNYNQAMDIVKQETSLYLLKKQSLDTTFQNIQNRIKKEVK